MVSSRTEPRRWIGALLWLLAVVLMMATAVYQRRTGPTHPARGTVELAGHPVAYKLLRSETTGTEARIAIPVTDKTWDGILQWRRYPTDEPYTEIHMVHEDGEIAASLPTQPAAGKLQYRVLLEAEQEAVHLPIEGPTVLRYKGAVPAGILVPHIFFMFLGMVWGLRTLLELAAGRPRVRRLAWTTLAMMLLGGMVLGPAVQYYAFGEAWTGVPFGWTSPTTKPS